MQNAVCLNHWLLRIHAVKPVAFRNAVRFLSNDAHKVIALPGPKIRRRSGSKVSEIPGKDIERLIPRLYFSKDTIDGIFGNHVLQVSTGNRILRELQQRRITGSLADKGTLFEEVKDEQSLQKALSWLRERFPVDEATAAELFAEREDGKFRALEERTYIAKGIKWGLIQGDREEAKRIIEEGADIDDSNVAKWKARFEAARRAGRVVNHKQREEQLMIEVKSEQLRADRQAQLDELHENALKRRDELEKSSVLDPEKLLDESQSRTKRLIKPILFGVVILSGCALLLNPDVIIGPNDQVHFEWTPALRMCVGIVAINTLVWCAWKIPRTWWYLNRYFMLSAGIPNSFSIIGTIFSHQFLLTHLATNTAILFAFGLPLYDEMGIQNFIAVYLGTGVVASLTALIFHVLRRNYLYVSLGASGAGSGLMGVYATLQPERTLHLPFVDQEIKFSSLAAVLALSVIQFAPMLSPGTWLYLDHVTHVGGWIAGLLVGLYMRSETPKQVLQVQESKEEHDLLDH